MLSVSTSGPLHLLFSLPGMLISLINTLLTLPVILLRCIHSGLPQPSSEVASINLLSPSPWFYLFSEIFFNLKLFVYVFSPPDSPTQM